jgi:hypothetical protein
MNHAALAVSGREGEHRKAAEHPAVDQVAVGAARCTPALSRQDPEAIVAVGITLPVTDEMGRALREQRPEGWR